MSLDRTLARSSSSVPRAGGVSRPRMADWPGGNWPWAGWIPIRCRAMTPALSCSRPHVGALVERLDRYLKAAALPEEGPRLNPPVFPRCARTAAGRGRDWCSLLSGAASAALIALVNTALVRGTGLRSPRRRFAGLVLAKVVTNMLAHAAARPLRATHPELPLRRPQPQGAGDTAAASGADRHPANSDHADRRRRDDRLGDDQHSRRWP